MAEQNTRAYRQVVRYLAESPWAILPSTLAVMRELIAQRLDGVRLEDAEIEQRITGGRKRPDASSGPSVAVVPLWGVLVPHAGMMVDVSQPGTGLDEWLQNFQDAVNDPNVQSILLYVDSPGGSADLVSEVAAEVRAARAKKDIIGVASTMAASAAYAIFAQASTCIVTPSGQVGSIGVYTVHEDISAALEAQGVKPTVIQAPKDGYKTERQPFGPLSEDAQAHLQHMVDSYYQLFVQDVAKGRGVDAATVMADYGKGRVLTAKDALAAGMVDGIASFEQVLARMVAGQPPLGGRSQQAALDVPAPVAALPAPAPVAAANDIVVKLDGTAVAAVAAEAVAPVMSIVDGRLMMVGPAPVAAAAPPATDLVPVTGAAAPTGSTEDDGASSAEDRLAEEQVPAAVVAEVAPTPAPAASTTEPTTTTERSTQMEPDSTTGISRPPTLEELAAHRDHLKGEMDELDTQYAGRLMDADAKGRFDGLDEQHQLVEATIKQLNDRKATLAARAGEQERTVPGTVVPSAPHTAVGRRGPDNIFDLAAYRQHARSIEDLAGLWKDGAKRANESLAYEVADPERVRTFVERLLQKEKDNADTSESFAHRILLTANPLYDAAFGKLVMNRPLSTSEEQMIRMAVSNTGLGSETPVPVTIDPSVLLTSDGQANPLRRIARTVTITGNKWRGISSDGVSVVYDAELATVADQTPAFDSPEAEVQKAHGWVEFSIEVDQDWGSFRTELASMFQDAKDAKEAEKFLFGTGINEPEGLIAALVADGGSIIDTATINTFALEDLELIVDDLPPRFDANARWLANKGVYAQVRALAGAEGRIDVWVPLAQGFANAPSGATGYTLLGYPVDVASEMSKATDTGGEIIAVLGDFGRGFVIVDRIGLNVEIVPLVAGTGGRPRGTRGMYVYFRNTSQLRTPAAFRALEVKTS